VIATPERRPGTLGRDAGYPGDSAPVAQWIERRPSKPRAEVRLLPGAPEEHAFTVTRKPAWLCGIECHGRQTLNPRTEVRLLPGGHHD
jgi:hypothetical protein